MNNQEKAKHSKNLKRLKRDTAKQGDQYMEVPKYLKGTLTRKLYEMEDHELKYWALYADLVKKLEKEGKLKLKLTKYVFNRSNETLYSVTCELDGTKVYDSGSYPYFLKLIV